METVSAPHIIANTDFTVEFNRKCTWRSPGVFLKRSELYTHKLIVDFEDNRFSALVQVNEDCKQMIFLN